MEKVGCVPPYIPSKLSGGHPVCPNSTSGYKALQLYEKFTNERFKKGSEVCMYIDVDDIYMYV